MSPKTLISSHAVDVGGQIVEPGQPIPKDADAEIVKHLEEQGLVRDSSAKKSSSKQEGE